MAKKRLNKKVALIGSVVFVLLVMVIIGVVLRLSRNPDKFIKDADAALVKKDYDNAERGYKKAYSLAKTDSLKVDMLYKLADVYVKTDQWRNVLGCWNEIVRIEPKSTKARFGRLEYFYVTADSGAQQLWQEVASQTSEFIKVADEKLLEEDTAKWESLAIPQVTEVAKRMEPFLYMLHGRAVLEMAKQGAVTDPNESLRQAIDDLEKVRELEPTNIDAYVYLAEAIITRGEILASRGNLEERDNATNKALQLLEQAVEVAPDQPRAYINLLKKKFVIAQRTGREQVELLEPEYLALVEKFSSSPEAFAALASFYAEPRQGRQNLDKAIEAITKAIKLNKESVAYAINAANFRYAKYSIYGDTSQMSKAIELAKNALTLPDARNVPGPRRVANRANRISLYFFLANCYTEQLLEPGEPKTDAENQQLLANAEQTTHEIEQLYGSGEEPQVVKWQGMLELAKASLDKGDRNVAIRKLYAAYEQLGASGRKDGRLSYTLAKLFKDTSEVGAVAEFLTSALNAGIDMTKPELRLDYADVLLKLNAWTHAISNINMFDERFGPNQRSKQLRIDAYIAAKQFDQAAEELAKMDSDDPNTMRLNLKLTLARSEQIRTIMAQRRIKKESEVIFQTPPDTEKGDDNQLMATELKAYNDTSARLVEKLLAIEPNSVKIDYIAPICSNCILAGQNEQADKVVSLFLKQFPDHLTAQAYKLILAEPDPANVSAEKNKQIEKQVRSNIPDPTMRAINLGIFYYRNNEPNKASEEFKKALKLEPSQSPVAETSLFKQSEEIAQLQRLAASYLFEIAIANKNWPLASAVADLAQRDNFDDSGGSFFAARLAFGKENYNDALTSINECLKQRPVFSHGYMLRSNINAPLGNEHAAIEDAKKAASLNPLDAAIAKGLLFVLYQRNQKLGDNVSSDQRMELREALVRAMSMNPTDLELSSFYAEYISKENPENALAIRQSLQKAFPSIKNALLLGDMAMKMALDEVDTQRKQALFAVAASSFQQAVNMDPKNKTAVDSLAEYYRLTGQGEKGEQLLEQPQNQDLLWHYYFRTGRFRDAGIVLEQMYQNDPKDKKVLRGLILIAEKTADQEAAKKYSEQLVSLEDNVENNLIQIQTFLQLGLIKEAEYKLQRFKEKFSDEPRAMLLEAWLVMRKGQLKEALELTNRSLETNQDNAMAWRLRGDINLLMTNYDQAVLDLKKSKSLSSDPAARISLAKAYLRADRNEEAITELKNAIDDPQAPMAARELLEQIYWKLGRKDSLENFYNETLKKFPDSVFWLNQAGAFALAKRDFEQAEQLYKSAWQKSTQNGAGDETALGGYLQALILAGKFDKVSEEAQKYVDGDFAPMAYLRMAEAKMTLGDRPSAIQYCRKAVDKAGTNDRVASQVLRRMYSLFGPEEVSLYCTQRLQANPDSLAANSTMFNLAKINGEYNKAIKYIDKCLQIVGPNDPAVTVNYTIEKASILQLAYAKTSDINYFQKVVSQYESLLAEMPNNSGVLNNLAYVLAENNERLAEALEYAERAYQTMPNNPGILDTYSYVLYKNGKVDEAAQFIQASLQQYEQSDISAPADVYWHLGMIKEKLGERAEALAAYKQALEVGADKLSKANAEQITSAIERLKPQDE